MNHEQIDFEANTKIAELVQVLRIFVVAYALLLVLCGR